ncbi:MAG: hypothetical protein JNG86_12460 [Verrucomicrobiaceae bacterium]|nr:hypothetical protein [Verrucomicrobiaceae bacterium]
MRAFDQRDLPELWNMFEKAFKHGFGYERVVGNPMVSRKRVLTEAEHEKLNDDIVSFVAQTMGKIPGHAKYQGDLVEADSTNPDRSGWRVLRLRMLGRLGTPEAVQQIGRFMFDTRNPGVDSLLPSGDYTPPLSNSAYAYFELAHALRDKSPVRMDLGPLKYEDKMKAYDTMVAWWRSEASLPWRQPLPGVELPEIVRHPPSEAELKRQEEEEQERQRRLMEAAGAGGEPLPVWVNVAGAAAALLLAVWLAAHKRPRRATATGAAKP